MSTENLDSADLKAAVFGGLINEDVLQTIFDISNYPLPFTEMMGSPDTVGNSYTEWTVDELAPVDYENAIVDGADAGPDGSRVGQRVGNHCQISGKYIYVSSRADSSDTIGRARETVYQTSQRQKELRRDIDAMMQYRQASQADDGVATPGISGGFQSWVATHVAMGAGGVVGGFNTGTGLTVEPLPGTARAASETEFRDVLQGCYEDGGNPTKLFAKPAIKRVLSEYFYTDQAKNAVLTQDVENAAEQATAKGAVDVWVTDFTILELIASRTALLYDDATVVRVGSALIVDPEYIRQGFLRGYQSEMLGKSGLSEKWQITADWTLKVLNEKAHCWVGDIDPTLPMVA